MQHTNRVTSTTPPTDEPTITPTVCGYGEGGRERGWGRERERSMHKRGEEGREIEKEKLIDTVVNVYKIQHNFTYCLNPD